MRFVIDESSLTEIDSSQIEIIIERFATLVSELQEEGFLVEKSSRIYEIDVAGEQFAKLLWSPQGLDPDLRQLVMLALDRADDIDIEVTEEPKDGAELRFTDTDGEEEAVVRTSPAVGLAYVACLREEDGTAAVGCIACCDPKGPCFVSISGDNSIRAFIIVDRESLLGFFREVPEVEDYDARAYIEHAEYAFPELAFVKGLERQCRRFETPWQKIRPDVTCHLSALNDHFRKVFEEENYEPDGVMKRFKSRTGVDASPASPNVRRNKKAWKERRISVNGQHIYCEWHTKIHKTHDRIHFHPGKSDIAGGKVIVGIFVDHLPT